METSKEFPVYYLDVTYTWFDSPVKDYTVKIYTKRNLAVLDPQSSSSFIEYDGSELSGFTASTFRGMGWLPEIRTFRDLWAVA